MSRIGKKPVAIPSGVQVTVAGQDLTVKGPKGSLKRTIHSSMKIAVNEKDVTVLPQEDLNSCKNFYGLTRSLVNNMVLGVSQGFSKGLLLKGVGYRAAIKGKELHLTLGYSHPVIYNIPEGIEIKVDKQTEVEVAGIDKEQVGQVAADIRGFRKPEPYHGKGVRYSNEQIITKVGKASGKK